MSRCLSVRPAVRPGPVPPEAGGGSHPVRGHAGDHPSHPETPEGESHLQTSLTRCRLCLELSAGGDEVNSEKNQSVQILQAPCRHSVIRRFPFKLEHKAEFSSQESGYPAPVE